MNEKRRSIPIAANSGGPSNFSGRGQKKKFLPITKLRIPFGLFSHVQQIGIFFSVLPQSHFLGFKKVRGSDETERELRVSAVLQIRKFVFDETQKLDAWTLHR